jgi:hypothetical protein
MVTTRQQARRDEENQLMDLWNKIIERHRFITENHYELKMKLIVFFETKLEGLPLEDETAWLHLCLTVQMALKIDRSLAFKTTSVPCQMYHSTTSHLISLDDASAYERLLVQWGRSNADRALRMHSLSLVADGNEELTVDEKGVHYRYELAAPSPSQRFSPLEDEIFQWRFSVREEFLMTDELISYNIYQWA